MFCFQCQETAGCAGCKISGVCGKTPQVAHAQDLLIYVLKGLGVIANHHQHGCGHDYCDFRKSIHAFVNDALFCTITNANFDVESIYARIDKGLELRDMFKDRVTNKKGIILPQLDVLEWNVPREQYDEKALTVGVLAEANEDIRSLKELTMYGLKGMAAYLEQAEPDFIDINWGCPVRKVAGKGAGSGILQDIPKMLRITAAMVQRAHLPVTVKTRIAYSADSMPITDFAEALQDTGIAALSIHGRTKNQMYSGTADWAMIGAVKNNPRIHIPIFGNGDITTAAQAVDSKIRYGVDGILIGRAAIGNPWIFEQCQRAFQGLPERDITVAERVDVCRRHLLAAVDFKGERTAIFEMRKHYGNYFRGLFNFKPFRLALVATTSLDETLTLLDRIKEYYTV